MKRIAIASGFALGLLLATSVTFAQSNDAKGDDRWRFKIDLRYRFETVDQDSFSKDAEASTLRTALSYQTPTWKGWSVFLEAENVTAIPDDDHYANAGRDGHSNGVFDRPTVADPELTELNQAYVRWQGDRATVTLGRQEINLGDQRYVGAVGWRQNHQSFDAVRVQVRLTDRLDLDYAYVDEVHRIFGDHIPGEHHLLTVPWRWGAADAEDGPGGTVTAYAYQLDFDEQGPSPLSSRTVGIEWRGRARSWHWELEAAQQDDAGENPFPLDAAYLNGEVGVGWLAADTKLGVSLGWEMLEGGNGGQFRTPLATLHKFNGWADVFLITPFDGLETTTLRFEGRRGSWHWLLAGLDFSAQAVGTDLGEEIDGQLDWKAPWGQLFALKFASYDVSEQVGVDVEKFMLFTTYSFGS